MNGYELSRIWFDWCFLNPDKISPNHSALYFFCIEHCNRLGWKEKFGLPTTMAMEALSIKSYKTYSKTLKELTEYGFIKMIEVSKNQYSSNIVALVNITKAPSKALDKAMLKHASKQVQRNDSIDKPITLNNPDNSIDARRLKFSQSLIPFVETYGKEGIRGFCDYWTEPNKSNTKFKQETEKTWDTASRLRRWFNNEYNKPTVKLFKATDQSQNKDLFK